MTVVNNSEIRNYLPKGRSAPRDPVADPKDPTHLYVENGLEWHGALRHIRFNWRQMDPSGGKDPCFRSDVVERIQEVHNAILVALSKLDGIDYDPCQVRVRLIGRSRTVILIDGKEREGDSVFLDPRQSVHEAMLHLKGDVLKPNAISESRPAGLRRGDLRLSVVASLPSETIREEKKNATLSPPAEVAEAPLATPRSQASTVESVGRPPLAGIAEAPLATPRSQPSTVESVGRPPSVFEQRHSGTIEGSTLPYPLRKEDLRQGMDGVKEAALELIRDPESRNPNARQLMEWLKVWRDESAATVRRDVEQRGISSDAENGLRRRLVHLNNTPYSLDLYCRYYGMRQWWYHLALLAGRDADSLLHTILLSQ